MVSRKPDCAVFFTTNQMLSLPQKVLPHHLTILLGNDDLGRRAGHIRKLVWIRLLFTRKVS